MSPEQAKGKATDQRTDIWAFGCVLFEALTGRKAFIGDDVSEILASVLRDEPNWSSAPASLSKLLRRCLSKDVRQRFHHIGDVRVELEDIAAAPETASVATGRARTSLLAAGLIGAIVASAIWWFRPAPELDAGLSVHFRVPLPEEHVFRGDAHSGRLPFLEMESNCCSHWWDRMVVGVCTGVPSASRECVRSQEQ